MPIDSHRQLRRRFYQLFPGIEVPHPEALKQFLEKQELAFFWSDSAKIKPIKSQIGLDQYEMVLCLPLSTGFRRDFTEKFCDYIQQHSCPIMLYWPCNLAQSKDFVALRLAFTPSAHDKNQIHYQIEILSPVGTVGTILAVQQFIAEISAQLAQKKVSYQFLGNHSYQFLTLRGCLRANRIDNNSFLLQNKTLRMKFILVSLS